MESKRFSVRRNGCPGFTLVELLVVIAIIVVLAALLLPALATAKSRSKLVQCANSERQIGAGFHAFLADHNGFYPYACPICAPQGTTAYTGWNGSRTWTYVLSPYLAGSIGSSTALTGFYSESYRKLLQCPSNPWSFPKTPNGWVIGTMAPNSYPMNQTMFPVDIASTGCTGGGGNIDNPSCWFRRVRVSDIAHPSGLALSGEMPYCTTSANAFNTVLPPNGPVYSGFSQVSFLACTTNQPAGCQSVVWKREDCSNINSVFHNLGANILFVDGHVEWLRKPRLFEFTAQFSVSSAGSEAPGAVFWNDGKGATAAWYNNQFPGAPWPWDVEYY